MSVFQGKWRLRLRAILPAALLASGLGLAASTGIAHAEPTQSAEIGMPFTGAWAYNVPTKAACGSASSQTSHPSCHEIYYGNWSTDLYAGEGTQVHLNVNA